MTRALIPVVVIGGYLGAGKTTLINRFLRAPNGVRATVLVNDFGAVNIDAGLIENATGDTIALTNGCACCSIGDSLLEAALSATETSSPDLVLIEASGIARPARISATLMAVPALAPATCLTVVNGGRWRENCRDKYIGKLFRSQIDESDFLCLNRFEHGAAQAFLEALPLRPVATSIADIWQAGRSAKHSISSASPGFETIGGYHTQTLSVPLPIPLEVLTDWLKNLRGVERLKGTVMIETGDGLAQFFILNYTQGAFELTGMDQLDASNPGKIVVIFRDIPDFKICVPK